MICAVTLGGVQWVHAEPKAATVRNIAVTGDDQNLDVKITANKPVTPRMQYVSDPDRLIVDLPEARPNAGLRTLSIHRGKLRDVRVALLSANPPITRVVLDLVEPPEFRVLPLVNTVVVKLANRGIALTTAEPAPIVHFSDPKAVVRPAVSMVTVEDGPQEQVSARSWAHWIMPILVTATVLAMLVIALIAYVQNRRYPRGI